MKINYVIATCNIKGKRCHKYPTPENIDKFIWQDGAGNCYGWEATEIKKPNNIKNIKTIPIQN